MRLVWATPSATLSLQSCRAPPLTPPPLTPQAPEALRGGSHPPDAPQVVAPRPGRGTDGAQRPWHVVTEQTDSGHVRCGRRSCVTLAACCSMPCMLPCMAAGRHAACRAAVGARSHLSAQCSPRCWAPPQVGSSTAKAAEMAARLTATHRWAVTGGVREARMHLRGRRSRALFRLPCVRLG